MSRQIITHELSKVISEDLIIELLREYDTAKRAHFLQDWEKSILHAGKFSELSLAVVKNIVDKTNVNLDAIHFDKLFGEFMNRKKVTAEDDILLLSIPRAAASIYCIRNKKRVAHVKSIDPNLVDSAYCVSTCDWILSQLVMLYMDCNPEDLSSLIFSFTEKQVPFVEQFEDGSLVVLKDNLGFKEHLLIALYKLGRRVTRKELASTLMTYPQLVNTTSNGLEQLKLIHLNSDGIKITQKGLRYVEEKILT